MFWFLRKTKIKCQIINNKLKTQDQGTLIDVAIISLDSSILFDFKTNYRH